MKEFSGPTPPHLPARRDGGVTSRTPLDAETRAAGAAVSPPSSDRPVPIPMPPHIQRGPSDIPSVTSGVSQPRIIASGPAGEPNPETEPTTDQTAQATTEIPQAAAEPSSPSGPRSSSRPRPDAVKAAISAAVREYYATHPAPPRGEYTTHITFPADNSTKDITTLSAPEIYGTIQRLVDQVETRIPSATRPHDHVDALSKSVVGKINGKMQERVMSGIGDSDQATDHAARTTLTLLNAKTILVAVNRAMTNFEIPEEQRDALTKKALDTVYTRAHMIREKVQNDTLPFNTAAKHINDILRDALRPHDTPRRPDVIVYAPIDTRNPSNSQEIRRLLADVTSETTHTANDYQRIHNDATTEEIEAGLRQLVDRFNHRAQELAHTGSLSYEERKRINHLGKFLEGLVRGLDKKDLIDYARTGKNYYAQTYQKLVDFLTPAPQ